MARQSSMSYPGQGRPKDPNLPKTLPEADRDRERPRSQNPKLARIHQDKKPKRERGT